MIVLDASAVLESLFGTPRAGAVARWLARPGETFHAPHFIDLEVAQVLRRCERSGFLTASRSAEALDDFRILDLTRWPHDDLLPRIWALRKNLTAYDASYIALAETLEAPLLTADARLARSTGHQARVELVSA